MVIHSYSALNARPTSFTVLLLALILSLSACAKRARNQGLTTSAKANDQQSGTSPQASANQPAERININSASAGELEKLPGIGKGLATRIIEHREKWGAFRRPEHLIAVRGISDIRFRALKDLVTVE